MKKAVVFLTFLLAVCPVAATGCADGSEPAGNSASQSACGQGGETPSFAAGTYAGDGGQGDKSPSVSRETAIEDLLDKYLKMPACAVVTPMDLSLMDAGRLFCAQEISDELFVRMYGNSFKEDCTVARDDLRYLRVLYMGFDGEAHIGELVVNQLIAEDVLDIFSQLYENSYPIEKVRLVDDYGADDERSMADNNTSCFNFRKVPNSTHLSNHALGLALDVNPLYNPYVRTVGGETLCGPAEGAQYMDRNQDFPYKIDESDLCYQIFTEYGFTWGGHWKSSKDYQHFEKIIEF